MDVIDNERATRITLTLSSKVDKSGGSIFGTKKIHATSLSTVKSSGASYAIDLISAKSRHYSSNHVLQGQSIDVQQYSSRAGKTYDTGATNSTGYGTGVHIYDDSGFNQVEHETFIDL